MLVGVRIDKWLWAVRIYKTRALATEACKKSRVLINGQIVKPSRDVKIGDTVTVRKLPVIYNFLVKNIIEKRISAKLVEDYLEDRTSIEELDKLNIKETIYLKRERGTGRPTKKDRRQLDQLNENLD